MTITADDETLHGLPRLEGTRISVLHIYDMVVDGGADPAGVADDLDISLGDVYEALAYYYNHPDEMRTHRETQDEARDELQDRAVASPVDPDSTG